MRDSLARLFQRYIRVDPSNASKLELQLNSGKTLLEFRGDEGQLHLEGPEALTNDLANLVQKGLFTPSDIKGAGAIYQLK